MNWETKAWGKTRCTDFDKYRSLHELEISAGGFCSVHYHTARKNIFHITKGRLKIVWCFGWKLLSKVIEEGENFHLMSGVPHQFQAISYCEAVEEYASDRADLREIALDDITRLSVGGMMQTNEVGDCSVFEQFDCFFLQDLTPVCFPNLQ